MPSTAAGMEVGSKHRETAPTPALHLGDPPLLILCLTHIARFSAWSSAGWVFTAYGVLWSHRHAFPWSKRTGSWLVFKYVDVRVCVSQCFDQRHTAVTWERLGSVTWVPEGSSPSVSGHSLTEDYLWPNAPGKGQILTQAFARGKEQSKKKYKWNEVWKRFQYSTYAMMQGFYREDQKELRTPINRWKVNH